MAASCYATWKYLAELLNENTWETANVLNVFGVWGWLSLDIFLKLTQETTSSGKIYTVCEGTERV